MSKGFFIHGHEERADGACDRCEQPFGRHRGAYLVSHDGVMATHRICGACHADLRSAYGIAETEPPRGKP